AGEAEHHHNYVYHTWDRYFPNPDRRWGISDQRWKLMAQFGTDAEPDPSGWRLYDLESDPGETTNVIKQQSEIAERLRAEFVRWFEDVTEGIDYQPIRIPVGDPREDPVEIEPSWATWEGDHIQYTFDGYDWDTIDSWKSPAETAKWQLDVKSAGSYRVSLSYGCRPLDAGGALRLSSGDSSIEHTVKATATAEQYGVFEIGTLNLEAGEVELIAEVIEAPGKELMQLNGIFLEKAD
ncbi:MAG: hypothetical protein AAGA96_16775, partial [Verrucomicrobiota bacterium]